MADLSITPVATQIRPVPQMSLADMVGLARGVQAYQQAQQLNPIEVERAQAELGRLQQLTPEEVTRAKALAQQATTEARVSAKTEEPRVTRAGAEAGTAQAQEQSAKLKLALDQVNAISDRITSLYTNPTVLAAEKDPEFAKKNKGALAALMHDYGNEQASALGLSPDKKSELILPYVKEALENPSGLRKFLEGKQLAAIDARSRLAAMQPQGVQVDYSSGSVQVDKNPLSPTYGQPIPGTQVVKGAAPFVGTTETGAPAVFKGMPGQIINAPQVAPPGAPPAAGRPSAQPSVQAGAAPKTTEEKISLAPGETYEAYKERTKRLGQLPSIANQAMNLANVESVPNMEYTNDKILKLLEKKSVDVGPIADAVAKKTGGIGLSSDQQEVMKYLEQRIRQQASRTDQDQNSLRSAFGNFATGKDALMDILYNDKGTLASQKMFYSGIRKVQGDPRKPNLAAVSEFENKFNDINRDPDVAHLMGVIGNKNASQLTQTDRQHLNKYFGNMSPERIKDLFSKRDELMRLVEGEK